MKRFWASSTNKEQLQLFFIKWICEKYDKDIPLYFGGCVPGDITGCVKVCSHVVSDVPAMKCGHEEADNRILFYINHAIKDENYTKIIVASHNTDVFVCCLFHLTRWMYMGAWPARHALTGCDTTNTVGTKRAALKLGETDKSEMLTSFGKEPLTWDVIEAAKKFLVALYIK